MKDSLLLWAPRLTGILISCFLSVFALDAFSGRSADDLRDVAVHLVPSLMLLLLVALAWRRPGLGAITFLVLAAIYSLTTNRTDWILVIAGPLAFAGLLYLASWLLGPARLP